MRVLHPHRRLPSPSRLRQQRPDGQHANVDENLTAENIVSNDVTAIDAVTGDAANMAADVNYERRRRTSMRTAAVPRTTAASAAGGRRRATPPPRSRDDAAANRDNAATD